MLAAALAANAGGSFLPILFNKDPDFAGMKRQAIDDIESTYGRAKDEAVKTAYNLADATIGEATNALHAGNIAGTSGAGTGRLNAATYARIAENRDTGVQKIVNALAQNKAAMISSRLNAIEDQQLEYDKVKPNMATGFTNFIKGLPASIGIGMELQDFFKGSTKLPKTVPNMRIGEAIDKGTSTVASMGGTGLPTQFKQLNTINKRAGLPSLFGTPSRDYPSFLGGKGTAKGINTVTDLLKALRGESDIQKDVELNWGGVL
jgi:hypothetical protein